MSAAVVSDQPEPHARPFFGPSSTESSLRFARQTSFRQKEQPAKSGIFGRPRNPSDASSRKMLISAPTHFRHLSSGSQHAFPSLPLRMHPLVPEAARAPQMPEFFEMPYPSGMALVWEPESHRESLPPLEPLELSIYRAQNRLSPILPQFELPIMVPSPPPAYASDEPEQDTVLQSERSLPILFHVPRRPTQRSPPRSPDAAEIGNASTTAPTHTTESGEIGRSRAFTATDVEAIRSRVANAMLEVERLQQKIDDVTERQSVYTLSRPSSAYSSRSFARTLPDLEPMPSIPALPPSAPSFAERLHGESEIPSTTRASSPVRVYTMNGARAQGSQSQPAGCDGNEDIMSPPLPLVLRPPLRKKKPFSGGFSTFVFPAPPRKQEGSLDSVTNMPRPITGADGFYQCIPVNGVNMSYESLHSLSTSDGGTQSNAPSMHSPYSPTTPREIPIERCATFGQDEKGRRMSVGVAL